MTQKNPIRHEDNEVPIVSILPVGKPIPISSIETTPSELLKNNAPVQHEKTNPPTSKTGDVK